MKYVLLLVAVLGMGCGLGQKVKVRDGRVVNALTGEPVPGATVGLVGRKQLNRTLSLDKMLGISKCLTLTDEAGKFEFPNTEGCDDWVAAEADGFLRRGYPEGYEQVVTRSDEIEGVEVRTVEVRLQPEAVLAGKLLDQNGDAHVNTYIYAASKVRSPEGEVNLVEKSAMFTNDLGEFRLRGLPAGEYLLGVRPEKRPRGASTPPDLLRQRVRAARSGLYPQGVPIERAERFQLKSGQKIEGIQFQVDRVPSYVISGIVEMKPEKVSIQLTRIDVGSNRAPYFVSKVAEVGSAREFKFEAIEPGRYRLEPAGTTKLKGSLEITLGESDLKEVVLPLVRVSDSAEGSRSK